MPLLRNQRLFRRLVGVPLTRKRRDKTIWIHALSVGEVLSALPLVKSLRKQFPAEELAFTVTTRQGMAIAQRELQNDVSLILPLPLDFWWPMLRMIRCIQPRLFILVETDLWPGLINHLATRGVKSMLVNGRVSPGTLKSYKRFSFLFKRILNLFHACLVQTELDRTRLLEAGVKAEKVRSLGNIKFDRGYSPMDEEERREWLEAFSLSRDDAIWLAGSTHRGEEAIILDIFKKIRPAFPKLRLIIAPRRTERAEEIERLSKSKGLKTARRKAITRESAFYDVLILDTMGELNRIYGIAGISFVGGSLVPEGGHNLLEPASFGCPVLFGPHMDDFKIMAELMLEAGGAIRVHDPEQLLQTVLDLLSKPLKKKALGAKAKQFVESNQGAVQRVLAEIRKVLS
ncbi:MAG: 3-deoxy-D-manno-octulosonic acid transferase [Deltaproteobacteria bacterium]|nr:3-deoxy-D-manno-octulosonic acid transferase [Deltaproteobacteria bacterium]